MREGSGFLSLGGDGSGVLTETGMVELSQRKTGVYKGGKGRKGVPGSSTCWMEDKREQAVHLQEMKSCVVWLGHGGRVTENEAGQWPDPDRTWEPAKESGFDPEQHGTIEEGIGLFCEGECSVLLEGSFLRDFTHRLCNLGNSQMWATWVQDALDLPLYLACV